jgi:hypothetical protein
MYKYIDIFMQWNQDIHEELLLYLMYTGIFSIFTILLRNTTQLIYTNEGLVTIQ